MVRCKACRRDFKTPHALRQHQNTISHIRKFYKYACPYGCLWGSNNSSQMDEHKETKHYWCKQHEKRFENQNNLNQHLLSKEHLSGKRCSFCGVNSFPTLYALALHLEGGRCEGGANRFQVDRRIHEADVKGLLTNHKSIESNNSWQAEQDTWATKDTDGQCHLCDNKYNSLGRLNAHITQMHAEKRDKTLYHCPESGCNREFCYFSSWMGHVEQTNTCGVRQNASVQEFSHTLLDN